MRGRAPCFTFWSGCYGQAGGGFSAFGHERRTEKDFLDVRRLAGLVFQDPDDQLFCPTVAEDIAFGPLNLGKSRQACIEIVEKVLADLDLGHMRDRITHKLSGGEKRLVTLASVLAMDDPECCCSTSRPMPSTNRPRSVSSKSSSVCRRP